MPTPAGDVYVVDRADQHGVGRPRCQTRRGIGPRTELPFVGLQRPLDFAVDAMGSVYVTDMDTFRVLKLTMP